MDHQRLDNAPESYRYQAFISYSSRDKKWGDWLHRAMETYRIPKKLRTAAGGQDLPKRVFPVFRDRAELSTSADLNAQIGDTLRYSKCLVVICSPNAAKSQWVNEEIRQFKAMGREHHVLAFIVDGEPNASDSPDQGLKECFPEALRHRVDADGRIAAVRVTPIAADARPTGDGRKNAFLKLMAGVLGVGFDSLRQRDQERRMRRMVYVTVGLALLVLAFAILTWLAWRAERQMRSTLADIYAREGRKASDKDDWGGALLWLARSLEVQDNRAARVNAADVLDRNDWLELARIDGGKGRWGTPIICYNKMLLAVAYEDGFMRVTALDTGKPVAVLARRENEVPENFSPDGRFLVSGAMDHVMHLWDLDSCSDPTHCQEPKIMEDVSALAFCPNGQCLIVGFLDKTTRILDLASDKPPVVLKEKEDLMDAMTHKSEHGVSSLAISRDGVLLAVGSTDTSIRLFDTATGQELAVLRGHMGRVDCLAFSRDGRTLASEGLGEKRIRFWDLANNTQISEHAVPEDIITSITFLPGGKNLAIASLDNIRFLDWKKEKDLGMIDTRLTTRVAVSPDGSTIASLGAMDKAIHLWDRTTGNEIAILKGHKQDVDAVVFSPDGLRLASGSLDNTIRVWDRDTGRGLAVLVGHRDSVRGLIFSPDGQRLASWSNDNTLRFWDLETGRQLNIVALPKDYLTVGTFDSNWGSLVLGTRENGVHRFDFASGKELPVLAKPEKKLKTSESDDVDAFVGVSTIAASPDGETIATVSGDDKNIVLWNREDGKKILVLRAEASVNALAFDPDGMTIAAGTSAHTIEIWDRVKGKRKAVLRGHESIVYAVAFAPDGFTLASGAWDKTIRLWDLTDNVETAVIRGHQGYVVSLAFGPDNQTLVSRALDGALRIWSRVDGARMTRVLEDKNDPDMDCFALSPDGQTLVTASLGGGIHLWDRASGRLRATLIGHKKTVQTLALSQDGRILASGAMDGTIRLWDLASGKPLTMLEEHEDSVNAVAFAPDSKLLASAGNDDTIRLWDVASGRVTGRLTGHQNLVSSLAFRPDGKILASGSWDGTIRLWNPVNGKELRLLDNHDSNDSMVRCVAFSPDGRLLVSGSDDASVRLWDPANGQAIAVLRGHTSGVNAVAVSPDGGVIASGSDDQTIRLWDTVSSQEMTKLRGNGATALAFTPDGDVLASASRAFGIRLQDLGQGRDFLEKIGSAVSLGLSYDLDANGQPVARSPEVLATARLAGARAGRLWWREDGGQSLVGLYANTVLHQ